MGKLLKNKKGLFVIPAVVSFFLPGLGQLIKGHMNKALVFFIIAVAWWLFSFLVTWIPLVGWILGPVLLLINVADALLSDSDSKG